MKKGSWFALCSTLLAASCTASAAATLTAQGGPEVLMGESPRLAVAGLAPGESVLVHSFRKALANQPGDNRGTPVIAHAFAEFVADEQGRIDVSTAAPARGTYEGADALGLLWSGEKMDAAGIEDQPVTQGLQIASGDVLFRLERRQAQGPYLETRIRLTDGADKVDVQEVAAAGLNGVFAKPKSVAPGAPLPAILLLHGSEGGSVAGARSEAIRFAHLGYAAFAVNYFAWPYARIAGIPQALVDIPVETLEKAREWLQLQAGVEATRVAVRGVSKGAELALVASTTFPWIDRVVACVPSSEVWAGFGRAPENNEVFSSWSIQGRALSYIPYDRYEDALQGRLSAAAVHERSLRHATEEQLQSARIPIEKTQARLLLLAAERDQVWPSAEMTRQLEETLRRAGRGNQVRAMVFDGASHLICGTGAEPRRINPVVKPEGNSPLPEADARAAERAWAETKAFLARK
jgi:dienelactone hydrolase